MKSNDEFSIPVHNGAITVETTINLSKVRTIHSRNADRVHPMDPLDTIVNSVCRCLKIERRILLSDLRPEWIVTPRMIAMVLAFEFTGRSPKEIARYFGKNRSTLNYAVDRIKERCESEPKFKQLFEEVRSRINL